MASKRKLTPEMFVAGIIAARKNCKSQGDWEYAVKVTREVCEKELPHCLSVFNNAVAKAEKIAL